MRTILTLIVGVAAMTPALAAAPVKLETALTGAAEAPGPGAPTGQGSASLTFDKDKGEVCYMLHASGTDTPTMAHIHKAAAGKAGPVVVPLDAPANGMAQGCKPVAADVLSGILASPADYYVNVHTAAFPAGALRGQLGK